MTRRDTGTDDPRVRIRPGRGSRPCTKQRPAHADAAIGTPATFSGAGVYLPELFRHTPPRQPAKLAPLLRQAMQRNQVSGCLHTGLWLDVGTPERLAEADNIVRQQFEIN